MVVSCKRQTRDIFSSTCTHRIHCIHSRIFAQDVLQCLKIHDFDGINYKSIKTIFLNDFAFYVNNIIFIVCSQSR